MAGFSSQKDNLHSSPLDVIEQIVDENDWVSDRRSDQEMAVQAPGRWCDYSLYFAWNAGCDAMHFTCAFDMRVGTDRCRDVYELLALINEKIWLGYFGIWENEGLPMFRHALPLRGANLPSHEQIEDLVGAAITECDRFYPAFQHVIWGGKTASEAVAMAMIDTVGEA